MACCVLEGVGLCFTGRNSCLVVVGKLVNAAGLVLLVWLWCRYGLVCAIFWSDYCCELSFFVPKSGHGTPRSCPSNNTIVHVETWYP